MRNIFFQGFFPHRFGAKMPRAYPRRRVATCALDVPSRRSIITAVSRDLRRIVISSGSGTRLKC